MLRRFRRQSTSTPPERTVRDTAPAPAGRPPLDEPRAEELHRTFERFYGSKSIEATQEPLKRLVAITGTKVLQRAPDQTVWGCLEEWSAAQDTEAERLTCMRIAYFTEVYHQQFAPQAGMAAEFIGRATEGQRNTLLTRGLDAAGRLDAETPVLSHSTMTVQDFRVRWSEMLGRPVPDPGAAGEARRPSD